MRCQTVSFLFLLFNGLESTQIGLIAIEQDTGLHGLSFLKCKKNAELICEPKQQQLSTGLSNTCCTIQLLYIKLVKCVISLSRFMIDNNNKKKKERKRLF
jgi:hypothetical protein